MKTLRLILTAAALSAVAFPVVADEITYRENIRPLWEAKCAACHGAHAPYLGDFADDKERYKELNQGPRMDTYADLITFVGWPDTGALMRRIDDGGLHPEGKAGNMYEHLGADEEERQKNLALFKAWVGGDEAWTPKRWGEITKEELDRFVVSY